MASKRSAATGVVDTQRSKLSRIQYDGWESTGIMSLQYRFIAQDERDDAPNAAGRAFSLWLEEQKRLLVDITSPGSWVPANGIEISHERYASEDVQGVRFILHEETSSGRWSTTLTVFQGAGQSWLWVDLEWVSEMPYGRAPIVKPPNLVQYLLVAETVHQGSTQLPPAHVLVETAEQARALSALLLDETRTAPIVVLSHDSHADDADAASRAKMVARELFGIAPVFLLGSAASNAFENAMPEDLSVYGGAARTFLPDSGPMSASLGRHRVMGSRWFVLNARSAATRLARPLVVRALATRPPELYREHLRPLMRAGTDDDADLLLRQTVAAEDVAETARREAANARFEWELEAEQHAETQTELDSALARLRWLEMRLREVEVHTTGIATPDEYAPLDVDSFKQVLAEARLRLRGLQIGETETPAVALDEYPAAGVWARKTWRALRALNDFALARADGWSGDFKKWCVTGSDDLGVAAIPTGWVALGESPSVTNNTSYKSAREFAVPVEVHESETVYMEAHIKIVLGGRPAPRVHFYDAVDATGFVYVGYVGPHLPNPQTN